MGVRVGKMMVAGRIMGVVAKRLKRGTIRNGKREPVGWPATRALGGSRGCAPEDAKSALEFLSVFSNDSNRLARFSQLATRSVGHCTSCWGESAHRADSRVSLLISCGATLPFLP